MFRMTPLKQGLLGAAITFAAMWTYIDRREEIAPDRVKPTLVACGQAAIFFFVIFWVLGHASGRFMLAVNPFGIVDKSAEKKRKTGDPSGTPQPTFRAILNAIRAIIHQDKNS